MATDCTTFYVRPALSKKRASRFTLWERSANSIRCARSSSSLLSKTQCQHHVASALGEEKKFQLHQTLVQRDILSPAKSDQFDEFSIRDDDLDCDRQTAYFDQERFQQLLLAATMATAAAAAAAAAVQNSRHTQYHQHLQQQHQFAMHMQHLQQHQQLQPFFEYKHYYQLLPDLRVMKYTYDGPLSPHGWQAVLVGEYVYFPCEDKWIFVNACEVVATCPETSTRADQSPSMPNQFGIFNCADQRYQHMIMRHQQQHNNHQSMVSGTSSSQGVGGLFDRRSCSSSMLDKHQLHTYIPPQAQAIKEPKVRYCAHRSHTPSANFADVVHREPVREHWPILLGKLMALEYKNRKMQQHEDQQQSMFNMDVQCDETPPVEQQRALDDNSNLAPPTRRRRRGQPLYAGRCAMRRVDSEGKSVHSKGMNMNI